MSWVLFQTLDRRHEIYPTKELRDAELDWMKTCYSKPTELVYATYETETLNEDKIII